jgi:putative transposase
VKFAWIDTQCRQYPLAALCEVLCVSVNGYRAWKRGGTPERQRLTDAQLLTLVRTIHAEVKGAYGSPRMTEEIRSRGFLESCATSRADPPPGAPHPPCASARGPSHGACRHA